jgi:AraC-like DNA-binding protein
VNYLVIPPCKELEGLISHFWIGTWDPMSQQPNTTYYAIASSLTEITFAFSNTDKHSDLLFSLVQGHSHLPNQFTVNGFYHLIGVSFHSYAIPRLFNIPSSELNTEFISLDTFIGSKGTTLNEKITAATTTQHRIKILSDYFISLLKKEKLEDQLITHAIKKIKRFNGEVKIEKLAHDFCLSQKQFNRRFKEFSGFSPKLYSRIIRFESVIRNHTNNINLTEIAHANGYYDQAHFIHEFKSFTGFSPTGFWAINK